MGNECVCALSDRHCKLQDAGAAWEAEQEDVGHFSVIGSVRRTSVEGVEWR